MAEIKKIQFDFSQMTPNQHRQLIKQIRNNGFEVSISNYQDFWIFRFCNEFDGFKFFKDENKKLIKYTYKQFIEEFKTKKEVQYMMSEKDFNSLKKKHDEIGKLLTKIRVK